MSNDVFFDIGGCDPQYVDVDCVTQGRQLSSATAKLTTRRKCLARVTADFNYSRSSAIFTCYRYYEGTFLLTRLRMFFCT